MIDLAAVPAEPVTRFAPSPTGRLHLGHVANAVWTWGVAARVGARVILRIEDHDRGRCRPEFETAIFEDLGWLGLEPDAVSRQSLSGGASSFRQSDNATRYRAAVDTLGQSTPVYGCRCSRRTIADIGGPVPAGEERRYPGTCRDAGHPEGAGIGTRAVLPDHEVGFDDLRLGPIRQTPASQCGDLLLRDATGNWTYQFAVVVDDLVHGVNLVIRGDDLLPSTGRQILLGGLLGRPAPPRFLHHPLIRNEAGVKLSKRDGVPGLDQLRHRGLGAEQVLGMAAHATGLSATAGPIGPDELGDRLAEILR